MCLQKCPKRLFEKFYTRYKQEELNICRQLENYTGEISNLHELIKSTVELSSKLALVWDSSDFKIKEKLQNLIFPEGIVFERKNEAFRTPAVNSVFRAIADLNSVSGDNEKGQTILLMICSPSADRVRRSPPAHRTDSL